MKKHQTSSSAMVFTIEEVAEKLGLSKSSAYLAVSRGEIPSIRIGSRYRVPKEAITELLKFPSKQAG